MSGKYQFTQASASSLGTTPTEVKVTHPFHPLHGEKLMVERAMRGKLSHILVLRSPDGKSVRVRRDWTDYDGAPGDEEASAPVPLLDIRGLREAAKIVEQLKRQRPQGE